ncbi:MAG: hypothetical protein AAF658_05425, partial [Myxococcota bacterium]
DVVLTAASLDPLVDGQSTTGVFTLSGIDGSSVAEFDLSDGESASGTLESRFLCGGIDDDGYSVVGAFRGALSFGSETATVANDSVFVAKSLNDSNTPLFLRWSSSSVDVTVDFAACTPSGTVVTGGRFERTSAADPSATESLVYLLKLSP